MFSDPRVFTIIPPHISIFYFTRPVAISSNFVPFICDFNSFPSFIIDKILNAIAVYIITIFFNFETSTYQSLFHPFMSSVY